jgi:AMP-binding enzyme C-terminal domain
LRNTSPAAAPLADAPGSTRIVRGGKIFRAFRVEKALVTHARVLECAMVVRESTKRLEMFVVPTDKKTLHTHLLRKWMDRRGIKPWMMPQYIHLVQELPRLRGKRIDRRHLATMKLETRAWVIPRIRRPLNVVQFEGVVTDARKIHQGWVVTLAHKDEQHSRPTTIDVRVKGPVMERLRPGNHIAISGAFGPTGILVERWERKSDKRTRIPLGDTAKVLEALIS